MVLKTKRMYAKNLAYKKGTYDKPGANKLKFQRPMNCDADAWQVKMREITQRRHHGVLANLRS